MEEKISNHPCHRLSIPSAKLFWCRHCMQSFEDPITRWRHSKSCKTGGVTSADKRIEQDAIALQNFCETRQRLENQNLGSEILETVSGEDIMIVQHETVGGDVSEAKAEYSCFICKRPFSCLEDMKEHVKYPCSKTDSRNFNVLLPESRGVPFIDPSEGSFPMSSRRQHVLETSANNFKPRLPIIAREPVLGEIVEQSADPSTGVRTFEVHSQNDDIPLSDILSKLSEGGYLVAGEEASAVNQVVVVQQVDDKGQITQTEHILPPHIQIQQAVPQQTVEELQVQHEDGDVISALEQMEEIENFDENSQEEVTYYITETGELTREPSAPAKIEIKQEPVYYCDDQFTGMNILTQAAEATIGNLIYPEKRKAENDDENEEYVKRSRVQCKPEEEFVLKEPPHSPRSPRQDFTPFNGNITIVGTSVSTASTSEPSNPPQYYGNQSTQQNSATQQNAGFNDVKNMQQNSGYRYHDNQLNQDSQEILGSSYTETLQQNSNQGTEPIGNSNSNANSKAIEISLSVNIPIDNYVSHWPSPDLNVDTVKENNPLSNQKETNNFPKLPEIPQRPKNSKKSKRRYSYEDEYKCRICDKTFRTCQLLNRHSQYPCKIFNTRNMSQKVLRPKRVTNVGKLVDTSNKNTNSRVTPQNMNSKSQVQQKSSQNVYRKPMLLLHGLKVNNLFEDKKKKQKVKKRAEPSYIPTLPSVKTILLPNEKLIVDELPFKEQFFYELDLVASYHLSGGVKPTSPIEKLDAMDQNYTFDIPQCSQTSIFTPLSISTDLDTGCLRNSVYLDSFSPPVLERMDLVNSPALSSPNLSEPPVLIPAIDSVIKSEKILDDDDYILDFSSTSTPKSKAAETRRHFMDLFIEASPITAQKQDGCQTEEKNDNKKPQLKNMLKEDIVSKLTSSLKKKLTPQKIPATENMKFPGVRRELLSAFNQVSSQMKPQPKNNQLTLPITKINHRKPRSGSKLLVVIFKQKSHFDEFSQHKAVLKHSLENQEEEDEICELLDEMLEKVSSNNISGGSHDVMDTFSHSQDISVSQKIVPNVTTLLNNESHQITPKQTLGYGMGKFCDENVQKKTISCGKDKDIKKLLDSMLTQIQNNGDNLQTESEIRVVMNDIIKKVSDSVKAFVPYQAMASQEIVEISDTIVCSVVNNEKMVSEIQQLLNEMVSIVSESQVQEKETKTEIRDILNSLVDRTCADIKDNNSEADIELEPTEKVEDKLDIVHLSCVVNSCDKIKTNLENMGELENCSRLENEPITNNLSNMEKTLDVNITNKTYSTIEMAMEETAMHNSLPDMGVEKHSDSDIDVSSNSEIATQQVNSDENANNLNCKLETIKIEVDDGEDMFFVMKDGNLILKEMVSDFDEETKPDVTEISSSDVNLNNNLHYNSKYSAHCEVLNEQNNINFQNSISKSEDSQTYMCTSQNFFADEGIVSDISTNELVGNEMMKNEIVRPVTVQYINRIDSIETLTSDKLNYGIGNSFDNDKGSPDYLANKISFSEEEIILDDSGLDDGDEIMAQFSLESDQPINNFHTATNG